MHVGVRLTHGKSAHNNNNMACTHLKESDPPHTHTTQYFTDASKDFVIHKNNNCYGQNVG